jgi:hypothetical protein
MKKTKLDGKLSLHKETLVPLQATELHDINGGTWGHVIRATLRYCTVVTTVVSHPVVGCNGGQK